MRSDEAMRELAGYELVPVLEGNIGYVKELVERCLDYDVPALLGKPPACGKT